MRPVGFLLVLFAACSEPPTPAQEAPPIAPSLTPPPSVAQPPPPVRQPETREVRLDEPPYRIPDGPPHAIVRTPAQNPTHVVVFLHGWNGCARVLAAAEPTPCREGDRPREGWGLVRRHDEAERPTIFVVAQLAWMQRTGETGRFGERGYAARWLSALGISEELPVVVVAHSAGFETALAIAQRGGLDERLRAIVLFDALYAGTEGFATWVEARSERRLVSYVTGTGRPARQQQRLRRIAAFRQIDVGEGLEDLGSARIITADAAVPHGDVPRRYLTEVVRALIPEGDR